MGPCFEPLFDSVGVCSMGALIYTYIANRYNKDPRLGVHTGGAWFGV